MNDLDFRESERVFLSMFDISFPQELHACIEETLIALGLSGDNKWRAVGVV